MGQMSVEQRAAAMVVLSTVLSARGFEKVKQIMEGDEVNKTTDTGPPGGGRGKGGPGPGGFRSAAASARFRSG